MSYETPAARRVDASVTQTIVDAVSDADGRAPSELPPLWSVVDPDALESVFASAPQGRSRAGCIQFEYADYAVTVVVDDHGGIVSLEPLE